MRIPSVRARNFHLRPQSTHAQVSKNLSLDAVRSVVAAFVRWLADRPWSAACWRRSRGPDVQATGNPPMVLALPNCEPSLPNPRLAGADCACTSKTPMRLLERGLHNFLSTEHLSYSARPEWSADVQDRPLSNLGQAAAQARLTYG